MLVTRREAISTAWAAAALVSVGLAGCSNGGQQEASQTEASPSRPEQSEPSTEASSPYQTTTQPSSSVTELVAAMSLEHKVAQLFMITPEQLTGVGQVVAAGESTRVAITAMPVGGLIYNTANLIDPDQLKTMLTNTRQYSLQVGANIGAFLAIDEEGGSVARLANAEGFEVQTFGDTASLGADPEAAANQGRVIGTYLRDYGFNLDFAPVADVLTNPENTVIGARAFSSDAQQVADCVVAELGGLREAGCVSCVKHFPGHGDTAEDSHLGAAVSNRTLADFEACEYVPFKAAIAAGVPMVMIGHISLPQVLSDDVPASLSSQIITDELRGKLGYDGVVISDSFQMEAITDYYSSDEAAINFINAGGDIVLMPEDFETAYQAVLMAAREGRIPIERVDESVRRILAVKEAVGLLTV